MCMQRHAHTHVYISGYFIFLLYFVLPLFQTSLPLLCEQLHFDMDQAVGVIKESVAIANRARSKYMKATNSESSVVLPMIAGSVGPYGACLHDHSEYSGAYVDHVSREEMKAWHRPRMSALLEEGVDLLACETIPSVVCGLVAIKSLLSNLQSPVHVCCLVLLASCTIHHMLDSVQLL